MSPQSQDKYYVAASAALADRETRILKQGETFAIFDLRGDAYHVGNDELGVYHRDTRYLSRLEFRIGSRAEPLLLNSSLRDDNGLLKIELTNPDMPAPDGGTINKGTVYIVRDKFLCDAHCFEVITLHNYSAREIVLPASLYFEGDFRDIFEIRGMRRARRGTTLAQIVSDREVDLSYLGLDEVMRVSRLAFGFPLDALERHRALFTMRVAPGERASYEVIGSFFEGKVGSASFGCGSGFRAVIANHQAGRSHYCGLHSSNPQMNRWVERSRDDLVMLTTPTSCGEPYPYAGIPWYCTAFGRDGAWTALQCLWANPRMAAGVLSFLAKTQATEPDPDADAEPGKIIHEVRLGEMAALKEIPFGCYYGSVDSTPLFLVLAGEYFERTGDSALIERIWPQLVLALDWIDRFGDVDGDGFVEYRSRSPNGLTQQGWKDSSDSIFHADGRDAEGPIALCEVQAYVYGAKRHMARLFRERGDSARAVRLEGEAAELRRRFQEAFWVPRLGTLALALDGKKRPCEVVASNAGHALYFEMLDENQAGRVADALMSPEMFSGWGVRTLSSASARYNPMSYHNGTVWPHDNSILAMGLAKAGRSAAVERIFEALFHACTHMEHFRMPEVFCGFSEREGDPPTLYPVACSPQAWASASAYGLVRALLGIEICAKSRRITFRNPSLPASVPELRLENVRVGDGRVDIVFDQVDEAVAVRVSRKEGDLSVVVER